MNCKNCGARLKDNARVCPNCGAFVDDESGYTLLTADDRLDDFYSSERKPEKKGSAVRFIISLLLVLAIVGGGAYYYYTHIKPVRSAAPEVSFTSGCGTINDNQLVIYATIDNNTNIQYIHGVTVYNADYSAEGIPKDAVPLSTDYEYTKNIDDTFRAIFFDTAELGLGETSTVLTFDIKLSFFGSSNVYDYVKTVDYIPEIAENAGDIVFDHSASSAAVSEAASEEQQSEEAQTAAAPETTAEQTTEAESKAVNTAFIYNFFWFTEPVTDGDTRTIYALKFDRDNTYTSTKYEMVGNGSWKTSTYKGSYTVEGDMLVLNNGEGTENTYYKIGDASLTEDDGGESGQALTSRKYNSIKNVEDFFGL